MPQYFFNVRHAPGLEGLAVDPEGEDLPDLSAAREHALQEARGMIAGPSMSSIRDWFVCSFEIEDEDAQLLLTVPFTDTLTKAERERRIEALQKREPPCRPKGCPPHDPCDPVGPHLHRRDHPATGKR